MGVFTAYLQVGNNHYLIQSWQFSANSAKLLPGYPWVICPEVHVH
ncbi:hypothetical protein VB713_16820 [Anabaena cylindrica UHCC 0172]|nr:hypothetical protein [Anabaena cylindrica]MEA5552607.1 hypothetical protein [Anabaena cylindrica UHCC 0172]